MKTSNVAKKVVKKPLEKKHGTVIIRGREWGPVTRALVSCWGGQYQVPWEFAVMVSVVESFFTQREIAYAQLADKSADWIRNHVNGQSRFFHQPGMFYTTIAKMEKLTAVVCERDDRGKVKTVKPNPSFDREAFLAGMNKHRVFREGRQ